jgi:hypothetical protein
MRAAPNLLFVQKVWTKISVYAYPGLQARQATNGQAQTYSPLILSLSKDLILFSLLCMTLWPIGRGQDSLPDFFILCINSFALVVAIRSRVISSIELKWQSEFDQLKNMNSNYRREFAV